MIRRNGKHLRSILSVVAKGLKTYVNVIFQFLYIYIYKCTDISKIQFSLCHYGVCSID